MSNTEDDLEQSCAFPGPTDSLFSGVSGARKALGLPSVCQAWYDYTTGYKEAADFLVAHVKATGWRADKLSYPILFLYRQHLELAVKSLIRMCCNVLGQNQDFPKHHDLDQLWRICAGLLGEISPHASVGEIQETTRLFQELCTVDPGADAFRFPEDKRGNTSLRGDLDVDLSAVRDIVEKMSFFLDCIETSIIAERDVF